MRWLLSEWKGPLGVLAFQAGLVLLSALTVWGLR